MIKVNDIVYYKDAEYTVKSVSGNILVLKGKNSVLAVTADAVTVNVKAPEAKPKAKKTTAKK